jgi:hypothetical protein
MIVSTNLNLICFLNHVSTRMLTQQAVAPPDFASLKADCQSLFQSRHSLIANFATQRTVPLTGTISVLLSAITPHKEIHPIQLIDTSLTFRPPPATDRPTATSQTDLPKRRVPLRRR